MCILSKNYIFIFLFIASILVGCKEEKKSESASQTPEKIAVAVLSKFRYTIGDSVRFGFTKPVVQFEVKLNGQTVSASQNISDTVSISSAKSNTGWQQIVVTGKGADKTDFADTLRIELISDIIPDEIKYTVVGSYPHQKSSFTEGLEFYKGELYEGTGQNGQSKLLKLDLKSGTTLDSVSLDAKYFGEGITIVNDKIYQLTWQSGVCFRYNMDFTLDKTFTYYTQGWGMTHKENTLIMSDGSNKLYFYNTEMEKTGEIEVYDNNGPIHKLNELEYVDGAVFANLFESTKIVKIDLASGKVIGFMKMDGIVPAETNVGKDVLNGIAKQPFDDALYITGKNWPSLFRIKLTGSNKNNQMASSK